MKRFKLNSGSIVYLAALIVALIGLIIYIINSQTGYMLSFDMDYTVIILSSIGIVLGLIHFFFKNSMEGYESIVEIVVGLLFAISGCSYVLGRTSLAADVWFIPVNYPQSEETSLYVAMAGIAFFILSVILVAVASFIGIENKDKEEKVKIEITK